MGLNNIDEINSLIIIDKNNAKYISNFIAKKIPFAIFNNNHTLVIFNLSNESKILYSKVGKLLDYNLIPEPSGKITIEYLKSQYTLTL